MATVRTAISPGNNGTSQGWRYGLTAPVLALLLALVMASSGCALLASANASHSGISPCVDDRTFTLIDLGISIGAAVVIAIDDDADDNSPWLFAIPGVFFASTIIGVVSTERCLNKNRPKYLGNGYQRSGPVLYRSGPPAEAPAIEKGEDAQALPPLPSRSVNPLRLPDDYEPKSATDSDDDSASPDEALVPCDLVNNSSCPPRHICVIMDGYQGLCKPADDTAPAAE